MAEKSAEPSSSKWGTILMTGLVSLVVGVATTLILDYFKSSAAKLEYDIVSASAFKGQTQKVAFVAVEIQNPGKKELELVSAKVAAKSATLMETQIDGFPTRGVSEQKGNESYALELPFLNPGERGRIFLLFKLEGDEFATPKVELRAKGIVGSERPKTKKPLSLIGEMFVTALTSMAVFIGLSLRSDHLKFLYSDGHSDDQRDVAAFILDSCGLPSEAKELRTLNRKSAYWSIADGLTSAALIRNDHEHTRRVVRALEELQRYAVIIPSSQRLINFDLARLYLNLGEPEKAKASLQKSLKGDGGLIKSRMTLAGELSVLSSTSEKQGS